MLRSTKMHVAMIALGLLIASFSGSRLVTAGDAAETELTSLPCFGTAQASCPPDGAPGGMCFSCTDWQTTMKLKTAGVGIALVPEDCGQLVVGTCQFNMNTGEFDCYNTRRVYLTQPGNNPEPVFIPVWCTGLTAGLQVFPLPNPENN